MFFSFLLKLLHVPRYKGARNTYGAGRGVCGWCRCRGHGRGRRGRTRCERDPGGVTTYVGREGGSAGVGVDIGTVVMGGVVMRGGGVCTGGVDVTVYEVVAAAPEVSRGAPLQIRLRRQRPGA